MAGANRTGQDALGVASHVIAIGTAHTQAAARIGATYVMDEAARAKLMRIVVKIARLRLRSGQALAGCDDIDALARLAVQIFVDVKSGAPA